MPCIPFSHSRFVHQRHVREFLVKKGYMPNYHKRGAELPVSVSPAVLARFKSEGRSAGPSLDPGNLPRLNWAASLTKDEWNVDAIRILTHHLYEELKKNANKYGGVSLTVEDCRAEILQRLAPVRAAIGKSALKRRDDKELAHRRMRRAARRYNVSRCRFFYLMSLLIYLRSSDRM